MLFIENAKLIFIRNCRILVSCLVPYDRKMNKLRVPHEQIEVEVEVLEIVDLVRARYNTVDE